MEQQLKQIWSQRNWQAWCLWPLSLLYQAVVRLRRWLYLQGWLTSYQVSVPVVVVGNISVGGTGKTPLVAYLANWLQSQGIKVGLVSRGYGGTAAGPMLVTADDLPQLVGDEAAMLRHQTSCPMAIGKDRVAAATLLLQEHPQLQLVISDDGLQHYRLRRDLELAVVDCELQFGNRWCLPAGPLREPLSRLAAVDLVVEKGSASGVCHPAGVCHPGLEPGSSRIPNSEGYNFELKIQAIKSIISGEELPLSTWRDQKIYAVAGIGNPEGYFNALRQLGLQVHQHPFPDHHPYQSNDFTFAANHPDLPVLMTTKDAVKCREFAKPNWYQVEVEVVPSRPLQIRLRELLESITKWI